MCSHRNWLCLSIDLDFTHHNLPCVGITICYAFTRHHHYVLLCLHSHHNLLCLHSASQSAMSSLSSQSAKGSHHNWLSLSIGHAVQFAMESHRNVLAMCQVFAPQFAMHRTFLRLAHCYASYFAMHLTLLCITMCHVFASHFAVYRYKAQCYAHTPISLLYTPISLCCAWHFAV